MKNDIENKLDNIIEAVLLKKIEPEIGFAEVEQLISQGASINKKDSNGCSPLHKAACIRMSFNKKAMEEMDKEVAARVVSFLIKHGADINIPDRFHQTPLHRAVVQMNHDAAALLVDAGADITLKDEDRQTPLDFAKDRGDKKMIEVIRRAKSKRLSRDPRDPYVGFENIVTETSHRAGDKGIIER